MRPLGAWISSNLVAIASALMPVSSFADPLVIAHRGASGYLPEHTLTGYERAIALGADYVEPDLVLTKDGVFVARHDIYLGSTTNVADLPAFASKKKVVSSRADWFVEDFTLAELKLLRARQPFRGRTPEFDDQFEIPTFQEVIDLVKRQRAETGRKIGIYPELKAPSRFESLGFDVAALMLDQLARNDLDRADSGVLIQSFEPDALRRLNALTDIPLVMLVNPVSRKARNTPNIALVDIAKFADGVGAEKTLILDAGGESSGFVESAHRLGLMVHVYTFRDDSYPAERFSSPTAEINRYLDVGIDGFFTDFPDTGVRVRDAFVTARSSAVQNPEVMSAPLPVGP